MPGCRLTSSVDIDLVQNVDKVIPFDVEIDDAGHMHADDHPERITFEAHGMYIFGAEIYNGNGNGDYRRLTIRKTRASDAGTEIMCLEDSVSGWAGALSDSSRAKFEAGDYIECLGMNSNPAGAKVFKSSSVGVGPGDFTPIFWAEKV